MKRGDTLSKIANEYRPSDVSLEQMLVALFRSNESAFDGKNMNRLRTGTIISIPPADQLTAVPSNEAVKVVKAQAADWRAYRDRVAGMAPASDTTGARQSAGGKITTAVEDKASATQPGKDQLKVSREAGKGGSAAGAAEDAAAKDKALREANARAAELEKTVRELQRAAELKNQSMAALQASADAANAKAKQPATEPPKPIVTAPVAPAPVAPAVVAANTAPAPTATTATAPAPAPAPVVTPVPAPVPNETKAAETKAGTPTPPAEAPVAPKVAPKKVLPPKPEPSFFEDLTQNLPTWLLPAAGLALVALIIGLFAARRRKTTRFEDSIISGTDIKTNTVFGSTGGGVVNTGENSLASDFSREGLGNIDTDEVDPIAEAEVYLAYGRDAQAEEILKDALKKDSQRQEIYLKLLEIHSQHNKPSAFETVASELYSVSGGQGEVWQKAMVLGRQLDPSNPLFADAGDGSGFAARRIGCGVARTCRHASLLGCSGPHRCAFEAGTAHGQVIGLLARRRHFAGADIADARAQDSGRDGRSQFRGSRQADAADDDRWRRSGRRRGCRGERGGKRCVSQARWRESVRSLVRKRGPRSGIHSEVRPRFPARRARSQHLASDHDPIGQRAKAGARVLRCRKRSGAPIVAPGSGDGARQVGSGVRP